MSGHIRGVQAYIREKYPCALYVHCSSHSLNLAISDSCDLPHIRNCMSTINKIAVFLQTPKRLNIFKLNIEKISPEIKKEKLIKLCNTRWVERHDAVLAFLELQEVTVATLSEIQTWPDKQSSSDAFALLKSIQTPEFQISLRIIAKIFAITLPLSKQLQSTNLDLGQALVLAKDVQNQLQSIRNRAVDEFRSFYGEVQNVCERMDIELKIPRTSVRQTLRFNIPAETPEEYFRIAYFLPFLDSSISSIEERLLNHKNIIEGFEVLFTKK